MSGAMFAKRVPISHSEFDRWAFCGRDESGGPPSRPHRPIPPSKEPEELSPLEGDTFMSFDEWKKQNLRKAGQSEHVGRDKSNIPPQRDHPVNIHNALDSLGDDAEIDLVFSGFIPGAPELAHASSLSETGRQSKEPGTGSTPGIASRSKDAGTTCKARFNYASFDCAATVRQTNSEASNPNAILGENKDNYMLNVCSASNKFLILELCDDISIDTIVLANFEFFSSIFRTFRVSVSDKYPVKADKWKEIGIFEARNTREVQAFLVDNPTIWARYLKIEILTHYGNEYYCPVSLVRVHGTTMMEEYKRDADSLLAGDDDELETEALAASVEQASVSAEPTTSALDEKQETQSPTIEQNDASPSSLRAATTLGYQLSSETERLPQSDATPTSVDGEPRTCANTPVKITVLFLPPSAETCAPYTGPRVDASMLSTASHVESNTRQSMTPSVLSTPSDEHIGSPNGFDAAHNSTMAMKHSLTEADRASKSSINSSARYNTDATASDRQKASQSTQTHAATPTMQESFFKSVHKRLQMLEANSSLSLQYIEDQSRALRHAFNKVEERQLAKAATFLDYLNATVLNELRDFRVQYDQLWQSTVIELEVQRERYQQENAAVNARLGVLADELIFQKRILILQMILIVICLALVLFARGSLNQYLDMPVVQRVLARSSSNGWRLGPANLESPTQSTPITRQSSLRKGQGILKHHRRMQSEDSVENSPSPDDIYPSPPTPTSISCGDHSEREGTREDKLRLEDLDFDPGTIQRPSTSPPILPSEMPSLPDLIGLKDDQTIDSRLETAFSTSASGLKIDGDPLSVPRLVVEDAVSPERNTKQLTAAELGIKSHSSPVPSYDFNEKQPERSPAFEGEAESEQWNLLIRLAITRFKTWWTHLDQVFHHAAAYAHHGGDREVLQLTKDYLPPLDVLLVWYAFMLEPEEYQRACFECEMPHLTKLCFPWPAIRDLINFDTMTLTITRPAERLFNNLTEQSADILQYIQAPPAYTEPFMLSPTIDFFTLVKKQNLFVELSHKLLWIRSPALVGSLERSYDAYFDAQSTNNLFFLSADAIPFGVDLIWRTHRLYPAQYSDFREALSGIAHPDQPSRPPWDPRQLLPLSSDQLHAIKDDLGFYRAVEAARRQGLPLPTRPPTAKEKEAERRERQRRQSAGRGSSMLHDVYVEAGKDSSGAGSNSKWRRWSRKKEDAEICV
ncbi:hypothetical protein DV737_g287, partial [Chaetothyriales sp. CBS 132003]